MSIKELLSYGVKSLTDNDIADANIDAYIFLEEILKVNKGYILAHIEDTVSDGDKELYTEYIEKRCQHIPLQHILGYQDFMGLRFKVNENVLVPRFDTEILVEEVLPNIHNAMKILDMCTGSGCILISLLKYSNECEGIGVDISKEALSIAEDNAEKLLNDKEDVKYKFVKSNLFEDLGERYLSSFDIIVSNPPYIASKVIDDLEKEVKDYDPLIALDGGEDGLDFYKRIIDKSDMYLKKGGSIFFEIGYDQGQMVKKLLDDKGYINTMIIKDYAGKDRVVSGRLPIN